MQDMGRLARPAKNTGTLVGSSMQAWEGKRARLPVKALFFWRDELHMVRFAASVS